MSESMTNTIGYTESLAEKIKQLEGVNHIIAHNLRGTATNIKMLAEVLMKKLKRKSEKKNAEDQQDADMFFDDAFTTDEAIEFIHKSSVSFISTLNTLLEAVEIQLNETIKYDECDIVDIVACIFNQLHGFVHQKKAITDLNLNIRSINYPKVYLESILYNLINNALKYSRPNVPLNITISSYTENNRQVIAVKDNGIGIDLERFGSRMFQLRQVFHEGYESKGVGLYITRTQVESLGGSISVKSVVNEGSEFIVTL